MRKCILLVLSFVALAIVGCEKASPDENASDIIWYDSGKPVNENYVDVFYLVATEILEEKDDDGNDCYIGKNTAAEKEAIRAEMDYARAMFGDSLNFFSPYYKQFTFSALTLPTGELTKWREEASKSALDAFRYYMRYQNNGRPFILAGFSQGAMHLIDIVKQMTPDEYSRMVVAYSMGYRLSEVDLKSANVKASCSADDRGTIVSFNSVATPDAIWPVVNENAATCINPINYRTDEEPASFVFDGDTLSVHVDTMHNVLIVDSKKISSYSFPLLDAFCKPGNLHHWDLLFYGNAIRKNALSRAYQHK